MALWTSKLHDQVSYVHSGRYDILWPQASMSWLWSLVRTWQLRTLFQCSVVLWKTWMKSESVLWNILQIFSRYFFVHVECCCVIVSRLHSPFLCVTNYTLDCTQWCYFEDRLFALISILVRNSDSLFTFFHPAEWIQIGQVHHFEGLPQQHCNMGGLRTVSGEPVC